MFILAFNYDYVFYIMGKKKMKTIHSAVTGHLNRKNHKSKDHI